MTAWRLRTANVRRMPAMASTNGVYGSISYKSFASFLFRLFLFLGWLFWAFTSLFLLVLLVFLRLLWPFLLSYIISYLSVWIIRINRCAWTWSTARVITGIWSWSTVRTIAPWPNLKFIDLPLMPPTATSRSVSVLFLFASRLNG